MSFSQIFMSVCLSYLHIPYRWGGDDPLKGLDCSGLAQELLKDFGAHPNPKQDYTAQMLHDESTFLDVIPEGQGMGDLVFFGASKSQVTHVAILLGQSFMLEAGGGSSHTNTLEDAIEQNAYIRIRPVANRKDLVGYKRPNWLWS